MAQYIDKAAIVAKIESYISGFCDRNGYLEDAETNSLAYETLCDLKDDINTIEVIEIDFEKELEKYWHPFIRTQHLIEKYVSDHADCRWLDAGELEQLLNDFVLEYDKIRNREYEQQCKCKGK